MGSFWSQPIRVECTDKVQLITCRTINSALWFVNNKKLEQMLLAYLAENQPHLLQEYLTQHLLPWSTRFLTLLAEQSESDFYAGLGLLSGALLNHWQQRMSLSVKEMPLYR